MEASFWEQYFDKLAKMRENLEATEKQMRENLRVQLQKIEDSVEAQLQLLMDKQDADEQDRENLLKEKNKTIEDLEGKYNKKIQSIKDLESLFIDKEYEADNLKRDLDMKKKENTSLLERLGNIQKENEGYAEKLKYSKKLEEENKDIQEKVKSKEEEIIKAEQRLNDYVKEDGIFKGLKDRIKKKDDLIKEKYEELANLSFDKGKYTTLRNITKDQKDAYQAEITTIQGKQGEIEKKLLKNQEENALYEVDINTYSKGNKDKKIVGIEDLNKEIEKDDKKIKQLQEKKDTDMNQMPTEDQYQYRALEKSTSKDDTEKRWVIIPLLNWTNKTGNHSYYEETLQRRLFLGNDENGNPKYGEWETYKETKHSSYTHRGGLW